MGISREEVEHIARLARLDLTPDEVERFRDQLSVVLERARRLQSIDLEDLPAAPHPAGLRNVLRPDVVTPSPTAEKILENAPSREDRFFKMPRILEEED